MGLLLLHKFVFIFRAAKQCSHSKQLLANTLSQQQQLQALCLSRSAKIQKKKINKILINNIAARSSHHDTEAKTTAKIQRNKLLAQQQQQQITKASVAAVFPALLSTAHTHFWFDCCKISKN